MNEIIEKNIENMIYEIRGKQVMLDSDLAKLYKVETKRINEAVKNNMDKFPERFCWKLNDKESNNLLVEIFDQKNTVDTRGGKYKNPRVFTEQGVYMLATILKSKIASNVTIRIMDTFVEMKKYISNNLIEQKYINNLVLEHDIDIKKLKETFDGFKEKNNHIFFEGQIYDAYSLLIDIFNESKSEIIIIDNYIDKKLLDIISKTNKKIIIVSKNIDDELINKYRYQYNNLVIINNSSFHDRFIVIDRKTLYHCGSSFKDLGKKCFAINKIEENKLIKDIIDSIGDL